MTGQCNYGGRVTDANDRITITTILLDFFNERIFADDYKFSPSGKYYAPKHGDVESYVQYAKDLPQFPDPEVFGFHENAAITKELNETNNLLSAIMQTKQDGGGGGGGDQDAVVTKLANTILNDIPDPFDLEFAGEKYKVDYNQSLNSVLTQELERFNKLIAEIKSSLTNVKKAIKGEALLSLELEEALNQLINNQIPSIWLKKSFVSLKPLGSYINDLKDRLAFMQEWLDTQIPAIFWINKFFFVHGFLTGAKQNYAREKAIPIDTMTIDFEVVKDPENYEVPQHGVLILGMNMEGCKWDHKSFTLSESDPKILFSNAPMIWFKPVRIVDKVTEGVFPCPVYLTMERKGVLATTGHSTNFVTKVSLPTDRSESHWIKRGSAMICALSD